MKRIITFLKKLKDENAAVLMLVGAILCSIVFAICLIYLKYYGFSDGLSGYFPNGTSPFKMAALVNHYELFVYGIILLGPALCLFCRKKLPHILLGLASFVPLFIFCLDCAVKRIFDKRIIFEELFGYGKDTSYYGDFIIYYSMLIGGHLTFAIIVLFILYCYLCHKLAAVSGKKRSLIFILPFLLLSVGWYNLNTQPDLIISAYSINNVYKINNSTDTIPYTAAYKLPDNWQVDFKTFGEITRHKNVILLFVESLDSALLEGKQEDILAKNIKRFSTSGEFYENYYSNAFNSSDARFTLLTGHPRINGTTVFSKDYYYSHSFIKFFNKLGYDTRLYTAAPDLYGSNLIFANAAFGSRVDFKNEAYKEARRYVFDSIDDQQLLGKLLDDIKHHEAEGPYLYMAITATTHAPYQVPGTEEYSIDGCLKYADNAIGSFVAGLQKTDFFTNGLLVIVGDHHSMRPVTAAELEKNGIFKAAHHVPLIILGNSEHPVIHQEIMDHASLGGLLEYLASGSYELNRFQQSPENPAVDYMSLCQPYFVQDTALAISGGGVEQITLNSDDTGFVNSALNDKYRDYLWYLAWLRQEF